MTRFSGEVAIVTGGAGGIGSATCRRLVADGARVVVADIDLELATTVADELGDAAVAEQFDAAEPASIQQLVEATVGRFGRLDILHNNAAITTPEVQNADLTAVDIDLAIWNQVMAVNLTGYLVGCKYAIPHLLAGGGGAIINTASDSGFVGDVSRVAYGTSKGAIITLTRYVASQHGKQGLRCNAVAPGLIMTAALQQVAPELVDIMRRHLIAPDHGQPEDIANVVAFLASDEARFINGQVIQVDGGLLAHTPQLPDVLDLFGG